MERRLRSEADTLHAGALLAPHVGGGMVIALSGDLGAGKTTLVRGLLRAAGVQGPIKSPTYDLVEPYSVSSIYFYHIDLYRFTDAREWDAAGLAECFRDDAVCLVEWPSRLAGILPQADVALDLAWPPDNEESGGQGRILRIQAHGARGERCRVALAVLPPD